MKYGRMRDREAYYAHSRTVCDGCGALISDGPWEDNEITVQAKLGDVYPESDCRSVQETDCCKKCWTAKVRPALEAIGFKFAEHDAEATTKELYVQDPEVPQ